MLTMAFGRAWTPSKKNRSWMKFSGKGVRPGRFGGPNENCSATLGAMLDLIFGKTRRVLSLGAHIDDVEIGCGGTLLKLAGESGRLDVTWVVFSGEGNRAQEAKLSAEAFLRLVKVKNVIVKDFRA